MPIRCEIISQDRIVYEGDADIVVLPGVEGEMGILPNHAPLLTALRYGVIKVRVKNEENYYTVAGGVAEIEPSRVIILADAAENVDEIDVQRAEAARKQAEEVLKTGIGQDQDTYLKIQAALRRSTLRIDAFKRYQKGRNPRSHES